MYFPKHFANLYIDDRNKMVYKKSKYGEWINVGENYMGDDIWYCSKCDYDEICDMTNTIFEQRISSIEKLLYDVFKS